MGIIPYSNLPSTEELLDENSKKIYYDFSLANRVGELYHSANIVALLQFVPPELLSIMTTYTDTFYAERHGLAKIATDVNLLKQLGDINNLLKKYQDNP